MNCPKCGSSDTRKHRIAYEIGTSFGENCGKSQTPLAARCSPPAKPSVGFLMSLTGFCVSVYVAVRVGLDFKWEWWAVVGGFGVSLLLLSVVWFLLLGRRQNARYDRLYAAWERSWVCLKCGEDFAEK